jgi:excisionase family DNA binding protein
MTPSRQFDDQADDLLSIPRAAQRLGVSTEKCYELVDDRRLGSIEGPRGERLVSCGAIAAWLAAHPNME